MPSPRSPDDPHAADDPCSALAHDVRARRRELRLAQDELADLAGVSTRFVGSVEQGKRSVRLDKLTDLLTALGLELRAEVRRP